jgi:hypothetical protein
MASSPTRDEGRYTRRGDIFVSVTHRPKERSFDVVSFVAGYTFQSGSQVEVRIGNRTFTNLFTDRDKAWALNDAADRELVAAMRAGERMIVRGTSSRGTATKDTYSLRGFTAAHRAINAKCGRR